MYFCRRFYFVTKIQYYEKKCIKNINLVVCCLVLRTGLAERTGTTREKNRLQFH